MGIFVNTNASAMRGRNQLNIVNSKLDSTYQRLSSGLRINSAKDDAAGLAIADRMTSQINGLNQGNRNAADAIALLQTMEGGIDEFNNSLQQIRTLAVQAANGTNTKEDQQAITGQIVQLFLGMQDIAENTKFGGKTILNGHNGAKAGAIEANQDIFAATTAGAADGVGAGRIAFQIGANGGDTLSFDLMSFSADNNAAENDVRLAGTGKGGFMETLVATFSQCCVAGADIDAGKDEDAYLFHKEDGTTTLNNVAKYGTDAAYLGNGKDATTAKNSIGDFIGAVDTALQVINGERAKIGASMNRLDSTIRNQENVIANQSDARSRIRDTDFAEESAKLTQQNIIQQAAMSMLMQANARPQLALSMLGN